MSKKSAPSAVSDWETENDLHHLTKAAEIKADPKRHKRAQEMARDKIAAMKSAAAIEPTDPAAEA
jgi:hypothetical protein